MGVPAIHGWQNPPMECNSYRKAKRLIKGGQPAKQIDYPASQQSL